MSYGYFMVLALAPVLVCAPGVNASDATHPHRHHVHHSHRGMRDGASYLRTGIFRPSDEGLDSGLALGLEFSGGNIGEVEFGFGIDYYRNGFNDNRLLRVSEDDFGNRVEVWEQGDSYVSNHLPLMLTGRYFLPFLNETQFNPYFSGGLGYGLLWTANRDADSGEVKRETFGGIAWKAGGGAGLHLSRAVSIVGELNYTHNVVSRSLRVGGVVEKTKIDASGPSAWVGLRFGL